MKRKESKDLAYYLSLNYEVVIRKMTAAESGVSTPPYIAQIPLIDGLVAEGQTPQKALENLEKVKRLAFQLMIDQGKSIPEPTFKELVMT